VFTTRTLISHRRGTQYSVAVDSVDIASEDTVDIAREDTVEIAREDTVEIAREDTVDIEREDTDHSDEGVPVPASPLYLPNTEHNCPATGTAGWSDQGCG